MSRLLPAARARRRGAPKRPSNPHPAAASATGLLRAEGLEKSYRKGPVTIPVLRGAGLEVAAGEFLAVVGQSGSGKSTLLHLLATLDAPDAGSVWFHNRRIDHLPGADRDRLRNRYFGMVFQFYHLLPELNTLENVLVPLMIDQSVWGFFRRRRALRARAQQILELVGLGHRLNHKPRELSGGEMQRAAIARALVTGPELLLADEPTGNLDRTTGQGIMDILESLNRHEGLTIVMVTHDPQVAQRAARIVRLADGRIGPA
ncbi:MAG TPA: ABC transporter ATP-binding protein [Planctomycetaceae bacterium]|nr:ABC transporter ATP-binding protein [Planctomycetaceae bacterium]